MSEHNEPKNVPGADDAGAPTDAAAKQPPPKRKRRWVKWLLFGFVGIVILLVASVAALPTIVSQPAVSKAVLARMNGMLRGNIAADRVALSWFGDTALEDVRISDADGREVIQAARVTVGNGLWNLITAWQAFGEITIESPHVTAYLDAENRLSLAEAFAPVGSEATGDAPAKSGAAKSIDSADANASSGGMPDLRGRLVIKDGTITVARADAEPYEITKVGLDTMLAGLSDVKGQLAATLDDGATLTAALDVKNANSATGFDPLGYGGDVSIATDREFDIGRLLAVATGRADATGRGRISVTMKGAPTDFTLDYEVGARELALPLAASEVNAAPLNLDLTGKVTRKDALVDGDLQLAGNVAILAATFHVDDLNALANVPTDRIVSAALTGESVELPGATLEADGEVDLAALDRALPGMIPLANDQRLTGGRVQIEKIAVAGGAAPAARGNLRVVDLAAQSAAEQVRVSPLSIEFDARLVQGTGAQIDRALVSASSLRIDAHGTARDLGAQLSGDLAQLQRELGQIFDFGEMRLNGQLAGTLSIKRTTDEQLDANVDLAVNGLEYADATRQIRASKFELVNQSRFAMPNQQVGRIDIQTVKATIDDGLAASASGWYDAAGGAFDAKVQVDRGDLGYLGRTAAALGVDGLARYSGSLRGEATATRGTDGAIQSAGNLAIARFATDGEPVFPGDVTLDWSGVAVGDEKTPTRVGKVNLVADTTHVIASDAVFDPASATVTQGQVDVAADLARVMRVVAALSDGEPADIGGQLTLTANVAGGAGAYVVSANGDIKQLSIGTGEQRIDEPKLDLALKGRIDPQARKISVTDTSVKSGILNLGLRGTIDQYDQAANADLSGEYDLSWKAATQLLHELAPATADLVIVNGKSSNKFTIRGPLAGGGDQSVTTALKAESAAGWNRADLAGVPLEQALLQAKLNNGVLQIPQTAIATKQGKVNLGGRIDMRSEPARLQIPGTVDVLEDVKLTKQLTREVLSRFNPVFGGLVEAHGTIKLRVQDIDLPLGVGGDGGGGKGRLNLKNMQVKPGPFVMELLQLGGVNTQSDALAMQVEGGDFTISDHRIRYQNLRLVFPKNFDLAFSGSVGFDDSLDLIVSVPVREGLLRKLGVSGGLGQYAKALAKTRIDIPLVGTRENPQLDFSRVDVKSLVEQAVAASAGQTLDNAVGNLLGGDDKKGAKKDDVGDALGGLLGGLAGGKEDGGKDGGKADKKNKKQPNQGKNNKGNKKKNNNRKKNQPKKDTPKKQRGGGRG